MAIPVSVHIVHGDRDQILCYQCYDGPSVEMYSLVSRAFYKRWKIGHWCLLMAQGMTNRGGTLVQQSFLSGYLLSCHDLIFARVAQERYVKRLPASCHACGQSPVR